MKHFTHSLRFKVTLLVITVELLVFTGLGFFYTHRFSQEVDKAIIARLSIPGLLMSRGELSFDAVSDKRTMEGLLREPYSEGIVIGLNGHVYFSSEPARIDTHLEAIDGLKLPSPESSFFSVGASDLITAVQDSSGTYLTCLSPLRPNGKLTGYLYLKVGTAQSETEKNKIAILFAIGSLGTIVLTVPILSWFLYLLVIRRLNHLVEIFRRFSKGDYAVRAQPSGGDDEIATLMNGFNGLAKRLEDTLAHLSESESRFRVLVEHAPEAILVYDFDSKHFVEANQNAERLFACSSEKLLQASPATFYASVQPDNMPVEQSIEEYSRKALAGEEVVVERAITNAAGQQLLCEVRLVRLPAGNRRLIRASYIDITERKRAEEALRLSSERLQLATRVARIGIWDWDVVRNELVWDESMYQLYGIRSEDFGGAYDAWIRTIHPADKAYTDGEIQAALHGEREYAPEFRIVRPDGAIRYIKADSRTIKDREGKPLRMIGTNIDITEHKQAEEALQKSETLLNTTQRLTKVGGWEFDVRSGKSFWTEELYRIYEIPNDPGIDHVKVSFSCYRPEDRQTLMDAWQRACEQGESYDLELPFTTCAGRALWIRTTAQPVYEDDKVVRLVGNLMDITKRKQVENEIERYKNQLEETVQQRTAELLLARNEADAANKAKSVFLANMSHELRTPLNAILGFSSMMRRDSELSERQRDNLDIINRSGEHLLILINDVLEIAKIEAGRLQLENAPFDLGGMVRDVAEMMHLRAQEKGLSLQIDQTSEFPRYIKGDEARLRQILVNLVGNAVKFTEQGGVTIRLGVRNNAREHLLIEVKDSGPGISPEDCRRIFEPFVQLGEAAMQKGTGLGLTITKQFVQLMGGTISIESTPGKGALFRVDLPLEAVTTSDVFQLEERKHGEIIGLASGQPRYRILIAEDQHENQLLLTRLMTDIGLEVKVVENGAECVKCFQDWHPNLIWMDRIMPVMGGEEATRRIRQMPEGELVRIVAVTASAFKEEQQQMLDAGMNDFISKPYRFDEIYECLARQLDIQYVYRTDTAEQTPAIELTPAMLSVLSVQQRNQLKAALESLDSERIALIIRQISERDAELGRALSRLTEYFDYQTILQALDEIIRPAET